jgi:hypothetical protein
MRYISSTEAVWRIFGFKNRLHFQVAALHAQIKSLEDLNNASRSKSESDQSQSGSQNGSQSGSDEDETNVEFEPLAGGSKRGITDIGAL